MKNASVTIFSANFYPEDTAIGLYTTQFAKSLLAQGLSVQVITGFPYYPQWQIWKNYRHHPKYYFEDFDGISIYRYRQYVPSSVTFKGRVLLMLSFIKGALLNKDKVEYTDLVISIVPFTFTIYPAKLLAKKHNAPLWVHVQDLEFDLASETGVTKGNFAARLIKPFLPRLERFLLNRADIISSISYSMLNKIREKCNVEKQVYFPNWVSANDINPHHYSQHRYINSNKFTLLYSGNIGEKQDWDIFVAFCSLIEDVEIEIVIVGDGGYAHTLKKRCEEFSFVKFMPLVEYSELSDLLCSVNLHFLFQKTDVVDTIMPSKILGMMASEKPSIITGNALSEVAAIMAQSQGGIFLGSNDISPESIHSEVLRLKADKGISAKMGQNARKFILENFSAETILDNVSKEIKNAINSK